MMKKYIFLTNIPTPYRTSFYNDLADRNFDFEVYYMRDTHADRGWSVDYDKLKHPYLIDNSGFYKMKGRFHFHFNPKLIFRIFKAKKSEIIIGGDWNNFNVLAVILLKRVGLLKNQLHFWSEANYLTIGASNDNFLKKIIRKFVYNSTTGAQLSSGKMTELTLNKWEIKVHGYVPLPNTIEEEKFQISEQDISRRAANELPTFLMPVRLHEQVKGIVNFFKSIGLENIRKGLFLVAGDGPDRDNIEQFIVNNKVGENIKLLGHCDIEKLVSLYTRSNIFVLPSYTDASPLTLIEALRMHLPLLVSERCGNHYEAVINGENGYLFDPSKADSVKKAFEVLMTNQLKWKSMGEISGKLYDENFSKQMVIENFISAISKFSGSETMSNS